MARSLTAFLRRADVPARDALQPALDALKLKLTLDDGYVPLKSSGYLPCTLDGEDAGFTIRFHHVDADLDALPQLKAAMSGQDVAIDIKWGEILLPVRIVRTFLISPGLKFEELDHHDTQSLHVFDLFCSRVLHLSALQ